MGEKGMNGHSATTIRNWKVGFMNAKLKYLTAETFGHKLNAECSAMKKKQLWTLEQVHGEKWVYIRSHLSCYISSDKYGNVTCDVEEKTENERFTIEYSKDGRWAFRHVKHGNYFTANKDVVQCFSQKAVDEEWWHIKLDIHPQISLKNVKRKRYAHLNGDQLECTELVPWGCDSTIILEFYEGKYSIKSFDNRYLCRNGELKDTVDDSARYTMEFHDGCLAFKDSEGLYLTAVGQGTMKCKQKNATNDELFTIEDSNPQVQIVSHNGKNVSIKQGIDVSANQDEVEDTEIFQMEFDIASQNWALRTSTNRYWCYQPDAGGVQACLGDKGSSDKFLFGIDWQEDGTVGIRASDGKYFSNKPTGALFASSTTLGEKEVFRIIIVNRPFLVLKCDHGFVANGPKGQQFICNNPKYDVLELKSTKNWSYTIQDKDGRYWGLNDEHCVSVEEAPSEFWFEFIGQSVMRVRGPNKNYLKCEQNGLIKAVAETAETASLLEY